MAAEDRLLIAPSLRLNSRLPRPIRSVERQMVAAALPVTTPLAQMALREAARRSPLMA